MWQKKIKKTVFTLNVDNYAPEITELTYPLIKRYADKIGADFYTIKKRKFPKFPPVYEKLQIYELAQEMENDWNIYIDSDALVHPDMMDVTNHIPKDTVLHNGMDLASNRWKYDRFFLRDGRNIGSCNWFTIASDWCIELWKPLDDLTLEEAVANISPIVSELNTVIKAEHLIDDYVLSRNIAKCGLKFVTLINLLSRLGRPQDDYLWHRYTISIEEKIVQMKETLKRWNLM
jgi:arginyl-tRNA--protein-N-Asp/Glu arginylyltransferase